MPPKRPDKAQAPGKKEDASGEREEPGTATSFPIVGVGASAGGLEAFTQLLTHLPLDYRWFLSRSVPIRDAEGNVVRWSGTNTDITERRELEDELRQSAADLAWLTSCATRWRRSATRWRSCG